MEKRWCSTNGVQLEVGDEGLGGLKLRNPQEADYTAGWAMSLRQRRVRSYF